MLNTANNLVLGTEDFKVFQLKPASCKSKNNNTAELHHKLTQNDLQRIMYTYNCRRFLTVSNSQQLWVS